MANATQQESKFTPGPWHVCGVRYRMNGGEWHNINRYDEAKKQDENIACVGFDPRTGLGLADARLISAAPDLLTACEDCLENRGDWSARMSEAVAKALGAQS